MWGAIFPAFIAGVAYVYDVGALVYGNGRKGKLISQGKYDWAGKLKGSSLIAGQPALASKPEEE
jgi:hypothetical protein